MVAPGVEMRIGAVALPRGVVSIHSPVKVLVLRNPDVSGEDLNGQRAVGRLLGVGVEFCRRGVTRRVYRCHHITCKDTEEPSMRTELIVSGQETNRESEFCETEKQTAGLIMRNIGGAVSSSSHKVRSINQLQ